MSLIVNIACDSIVNHPMELEIYGEILVEPEFLASVKDQGILTPLIVTPHPDGGYICVSGHRRLAAARMAELAEVPAIIKSYQTDAERDLQFLISNQFREKTNRQRINEFFAVKQKLSQIADVSHTPKAYVGTIFQNEELTRILANFKIDPEKPVNTYEILKNITGLTEHEQRCLNIVGDTDYFQRNIDKLYKLGAPLKQVEELYNKVVDIRGQLDRNEISLSAAAESVKRLFAELEKKFVKSAKPKPAEKKPKNKLVPKPSVVAPKPAPADVLQPLGEAVGETWSQNPLTSNPKQCILDFVFKTKNGNDVAVLRHHNAIVGIAVRVSNKDWLIDIDSLIENHL